MAKTYLVQTWDADGALKNNYEVTIANPRELADLRKFLKSKSAHVNITPKPAKTKTGRR